MSLAAAAVGLSAGAGLVLVASGLTRRPRPVPRPRLSRPAGAGRALPAALAGAVALAATGWPVAAVTAGAAAWFWPELSGARAGRAREVARTEAVAAFAEMLRDTMAGAHGLEEAITTAAAVAPGPIRAEVMALSARVEREPLDRALAAFAADLAHPVGDLVACALGLAAKGGAAELGELLGTLALAAREEAAMRLRVEAARARLSTAVRVIAAVAALTVGGMLVASRPYLAPYDAPAGQGVLAVVVGIWAAALAWMGRLARLREPERILAPGEDR